MTKISNGKYKNSPPDSAFLLQGTKHKTVTNEKYLRVYIDKQIIPENHIRSYHITN